MEGSRDTDNFHTPGQQPLQHDTFVDFACKLGHENLASACGGEGSKDGDGDGVQLKWIN